MQWIGLVRKTYIPKSMHCPAGGALKLKDVFFRKTQLHRFFFEEDPNCIDFFGERLNCIDFFYGRTQLHRFVVFFFQEDPPASICCSFFFSKCQLHRFFLRKGPTASIFFWGKTQLHRFLSGEDPTASIFSCKRPNCIDLLCIFQEGLWKTY